MRKFREGGASKVLYDAAALADPVTPTLQELAEEKKRNEEDARRKKMEGGVLDLGTVDDGEAVNTDREKDEEGFKVVKGKGRITRSTTKNLGTEGPGGGHRRPSTERQLTQDLKNTVLHGRGQESTNKHIERVKRERSSNDLQKDGGKKSRSTNKSSK